MMESLQIVIKLAKNYAFSEWTHATRKFSPDTKDWEMWEEKWPWTEATRLWRSCLPRDLCHKDKIMAFINAFAFARPSTLFDAMMVKK
jgi:hypothetical protein